MKKTIIYLLTIFIFAIFIFSCELCPIPETLEPEKEIVACQNDIDSSIVFDTIWKINYETGLIKYFDKYFSSYNSSDEIVFYSVETGDIINRFDKSSLYKGFYFKMQVVGDIAYSRSNEINPEICRLNILSGDSLVSGKIEFGQSYMFQEDYFYYATKKGILKVNYEGIVIDTIYKFDKNLSLDNISMKLFKNKFDENNESIVLINADQDTHIMEFKIINPETKELLANLTFTHGSFIYDFKISENIVNISCDKLLLSYNLLTNEYYINNNIFSRTIYSFSNYSRDGIVFYKSNDNLAAFDMVSNKMLWSCGWDKDLYDINPLYLIDNTGNKHEYIAGFHSKQLFELINPYTGIVNATINISSGYTNSYHICSTNEVLLQKGNKLVKIKIIK